MCTKQWGLETVARRSQLTNPIQLEWVSFYVRLASSRIFLIQGVPQMSRFQFLQLVLFALALCCVGCAGGTPSNFGTVEGTVTLDGVPLANASVAFYPTSGERSSSGTTDENGKYSLRHTKDITGAFIGEHRVTITVDTDDKKTEAFFLEYIDPKKTKQSATVEGGNNTINFDLKSK